MRNSKAKNMLNLGLIALLTLSVVGTFTLGACSTKGDEKKTVSEGGAYKAFEKKVDPKFAYDLAVEVNEDPAYSDNRLGDRQAGSDAEHATAEKIESTMKNIGLTEVTKDPVPVNRIQAGDAGVTIYGDTREIILHAYQTNGTPKGGINAEIVDLGKGTEADYEGKDVKGKIILIDINQWDEWWIGTPAIQAKEKGVAAIIANNYDGFAQISDDAYNANDFCGPETLPTASITRNDAKYLRSKMKNGVVKAKLSINNDFNKDGESYNVYGKIKGKDSSEAILFGAHYDAYYNSFQDDTIAWTGVLAIAKAMVDSGYIPERDIIFCLHGSEEWGEADTMYDWAIGSYRQITGAKKDWQGKVISFINFELPAYEFADYTYTHSAPESYGMIKSYTEAKTSPKPEGVYKDGILTDGYQTYTYSDDFSYYVSGVPSFINGFLVDVKSEDGAVFDFYKKYYHTNFDTKDTYNEKVLDWQLKFYGGLGIHIDSMPALELDFTSQADRLADAVDSDVWKEAGSDEKAYNEAVNAYRDAAKALAGKVKEVNKNYASAKTDSDKASIMKEAKALNAKNLAIFKKTQDYLLGISSEDPIVPHEWYQNNIISINNTLNFLNDGDAASAVDESAWTINGGTEWYEMFFDKATAEHIKGGYTGKYASQNWATNKVLEFADVSIATRDLTARAEEKNGKFNADIAIYEKARDSQNGLLKNLVADEIANIGRLTDEMRAATV